MFVRFTLNDDSLILFVLFALHIEFAFINSEIYVNILAHEHIAHIVHHIMTAVQRA
jgi:hypothetical protein